MARSGRRPGTTDTRAEILDAARRQFTGNGFTGATIRGIAADAGVDPALIHHYFGAKSDLFVAALDIPVNPAAVLPRLIAQGTDRLGERIVETMLTMWDAAEANPVLMLVRSLAEGGPSADMLRDFVTHNVLHPLIAAIDDQAERAGGSGSPDAAVRATLTASQLVGLLMVRYVAGIEPLASLPPAEVARIAGPNVQRYLMGDLSG